MPLFGFLGKGDKENAGAAGLVRQVAAQLEALPEETTRYVAAFAYVLGRIAHADRQFSDEETRTMVDLVQVSGHLTVDQATLVVETAKAQHRLFDGADAAKMTRQFKKLITPEQRQSLLHCIIAVAAADQSISAVEERELRAVASDLGVDLDEFETILGSYDGKREKSSG
jgi:uncharacterized tellurite resistance protein B-like protein